MTENVKVTEKGNDGAIFLFHQGTNFRAYEYMGCHPLGKDRTVFRTWAPKADSIDLVSDFTVGTEINIRIFSAGRPDLIQLNLFQGFLTGSRLF